MITPIFKKGDWRYFDSYRPVFTLPVVGKINVFSSLLLLVIRTHHVQESIWFWKKHSTSHAVNYSVDKAISEKKHVIGILIDLSKAFNTIEHHGILLDTL